MSIAFLVQAHTNVDQLIWLVKALRTSEGEVFLHLDAKSPEEPRPLATKATLVPRMPVYHGGFSQVETTLRMLRAALPRRFDRYWLLSGQCFPVKSAAWMHDQLVRGGDFINCYPMPRDRLQKRLDHLQHFHFERHGESRWHALLNKLARRLPKRDFVKGMSLWPYAGSQWWCLRHDTARYVVDYADRHPDFVRFMRRTAYADEVFFQSIISNMGIEDELHPALFCADFDAETGRPRTYTLADVPLLDGRPVFMARKFDLEHQPAVLSHYARLHGLTVPSDQ